MDVLESNPNSWHSDMDIVKIIYAETPKELWIAAANNVFHHLCKLEKEHKIRSNRKDIDGIVWNFLK